MATLRIFFVLLAISVSAQAADIRSADLGSGTEMRLGLGILNGESGEFVYDADGSGSGIVGYKVSELNWLLNSVPMAGVGFTVNAGKVARFNIDYWANAVAGDGTMDDYDWIYIGLDWSHWSHHPDTIVRKAELIDVNGEYIFSRGRGRGTGSSWSGVVGYRRDYFDWQARRGYGIYSTIPTDYRDLYVIFPDEPGISYQQTFTTPYLGVRYRTKSHSRKNKYETRFGIFYSAWVEGEDVDIHHLRDLRFEEKGSDGEWYKLELEMDFELTKQMSFMVGYSTQVYQEIKASTWMTDLTTGITTYFPGDSSGLSNKTELLSMGISYRF